MLNLVIDQDDHGEMYYYLNPDHIQVSPCFHQKDAATRWYLNSVRGAPYMGPERRQLAAPPGFALKRRFTDIQLDAR